MKEVKSISQGFTLCFLAISAAFLLNAIICGSAISLAFSYEMAPWQSHILMFFKLITARLIVFSLWSDIKAGRFNLQGYFVKKSNNRIGIKIGFIFGKETL